MIIIVESTALAALLHVFLEQFGFYEMVVLLILLKLNIRIRWAMPPTSGAKWYKYLTVELGFQLGDRHKGHNGGTRTDTSLYMI